ncbi:MAG: acetyl-CoA carboxylase biotin carboxylase subunit, partial [candidate division Zixibacteria bacterium]
SPSPIMTAELRQQMGEAALKIARESDFVGAGTVEFMYQDGKFYFLEVNTRLQVEHPVTEMVTGLDLVREQINIASGHRLSFTQDDIQINGHAIECRIYAEDPSEGFIPSTGRLKNYRLPSGPGVRVDSGVVIYNDVPIYYDPMIAKMVVWAQTRGEAIDRTRRALEEFRVSGVTTTIAFHRVIMDNKTFLSGDLSTRFLSEEYPDNNYLLLNDALAERAALAAAVDKFVNERKISSGSGTGERRKEGKWLGHHRSDRLRPFGGSR